MKNAGASTPRSAGHINNVRADELVHPQTFSAINWFCIEIFVREFFNRIAIIDALEVNNPTILLWARTSMAPVSRARPNRLCVQNPSTMSGKIEKTSIRISQDATYSSSLDVSDSRASRRPSGGLMTVTPSIHDSTNGIGTRTPDASSNKS